MNAEITIAGAGERHCGGNVAGLQTGIMDCSLAWHNRLLNARNLSRLFLALSYSYKLVKMQSVGVWTLTRALHKL